jgi:hypothetical protein
LIVLLSGYEAMGVSHGTLMIMALLTLQLFAKEPKD